MKKSFQFNIMKKTDPPIVVEANYSAATQIVWDAITQVEHMQAWFFPNIETFESKVGFETSFAVQSGDKTFTHHWKITDVIPLKKIAYNWNYTEYTGDGFVVFELFEMNESTLLRLTNIITEDYPSDILEFKRESCIGGWEYFLNQSLKEYLEKK